MPPSPSASAIDEPPPSIISSSAPTATPVPTPEPTIAPTATPAPPTTDSLLQRYFGTNWKVAKRIAQCESRLNPLAHNYNPRTGDDSYGIFQINRYGSLGKNRPSGEWLLVAENNIQYAAEMYHNHGNSWQPWSCAKRLGYT